jgi:hypothetical protein
MPIAFIILGTVAMLGSGLLPARTVAAAAQPSAECVLEQLITAGIPITDILIYTTDTDPARQLGQPGQYIGKASWRDERTGREGNPRTTTGGTVETFPSEAARENHQATGAAPGLPAYTYGSGAVMLRVSRLLTPPQAAEYEAVLAGLTC